GRLRPRAGRRVLLDVRRACRTLGALCPLRPLRASGALSTSRALRAGGASSALCALWPGAAVDPLAATHPRGHRPPRCPGGALRTRRSLRPLCAVGSVAAVIPVDARRTDSTGRTLGTLRSGGARPDVPGGAVVAIDRVRVARRVEPPEDAGGGPVGER